MISARILSPFPQVLLVITLLAAGSVHVEAGETTPVATMTLRDCIQLAVRQNPRAKAALAAIEEAIGLTTAAKSGFIPKLSATAYYQYRENDFGDAVDFNSLQQQITFVEQLAFALANPGTEIPAPVGRDANIRREDYNVTLRLSQNLYSGGRVRALVAIAKLREMEQFYNYQAILNEVILDTRLAFYEVLRSRANVAIQEEALARQKAEVTTQESQFEAGTVGELNVLRAEVTLASVNPPLVEARSNHEIALLTLAQAMGMAPDPQTGEVPIKVVGSLQVIAPSLDLPNALGKATAVRPELQAKRKSIEQLERQITVERSEILPSVDLFATYEFYSELNKNLPNANVSTYTAGVTASWQIFDGFETTGNLKAVRAQIESAGHELQQIMLQVQSEVRSAYIAYRGSLDVYLTAQKTAGLARKVLSNAEKSYDAGLTSQIEILEAQRNVTATESQVLSAKFQLNRAIANLDAAIGNDVAIQTLPSEQVELAQ